jgi:acyl-CoA synthetase (NDP forming)
MSVASKPAVSTNLDAQELIDLLADAGVFAPRQRVVRTSAEAAEFAKEVGGRLVLKLVSRELVHKSDVGAVRLSLAPSEVDPAARELSKLAPELGLASWTLLVQEMVKGPAVEAFIGIKCDAVFGPFVLVGPGGVFVELIRQTAMRRCPVTPDVALEMVDETALGTLVGGYRGAPPADRSALAAMISAASEIPLSRPEIMELDLNPVLVTEHGACAVDARALVGAARRPITTSEPLDLRPLFEPRSIVVVGASARGETKPGNRALRYLAQHGYPGRVVALHPTAIEVEGVRAYPTHLDVPGEPSELACVAVAADSCCAVLDECGRAGVRAAVVFSSGFSDAGDAESEAALAEVAARHGIALCGPNSVGIISPAERLHACFSQAQGVDVVPSGDVAIVAQSGALAGSLLTWAWASHLGVSRFVSVGNQASLTTADYLRFLARDERTRIACVLVEGVRDGVAFADALGAMRAAEKSTVVLKLGRGDTGAEAVRSHTGSLAGNADLYDAVLREAGAIRASSLRELLDCAALVRAGVRPRGNRLVVLSTSGGACALAADVCEREGLVLPPLDESMRTRLDEILPAFAATRNPIDVTGQVSTDPSLFARALEVVAEAPGIDAIVLLATTIADPQATQIAGELAPMIERSPRPVIVIWTIAPELAQGGLARLREAGVVVFTEPDPAISALAAVAHARGVRA